jgi:phosphate transport system permease protein
MTDRIVKGIVCLFCLLAFLPVFVVIWTLFEKGLKHFDPDLLTQTTPTPLQILLAEREGESVPGGLLNGIYGSFRMLMIAMLPAISLGIPAGIYIWHNRQLKFASIVRYVNDILQGMPAILVGLIVYLWIVRPMHPSSALAGGIALAIILLPMVVNATLSALRKVPEHLHEGGMALGGSTSGVLFKIVLPAAGRRLSAGILIAISQVLGITAPLLIIAPSADSITVLIWDFFHQPVLTDLMWFAALFLVLLIFILNTIAYLIHSPNDE